MSEQVHDSGPSDPVPALPVPGAMPAAIAAGVGALACFLPWLSVQLGSFSRALDAAFGGFAQGGGIAQGADFQAFGNMFGGLGAVSVSGIGMWPGKIALVALAAAAIMHLFEPSRGSEKSRSNLLVGSVILSAVGCGCAIYVISQLGGPASVHVGLVVTLLGGVGAVVLSVKRLRACGAWRQNSFLAG
jgi:hypothetical protein